MTGAAVYVAAGLDIASIARTIIIRIQITAIIRDIGVMDSAITTMASGTAMDTTAITVITKTARMRGSSSPHRGRRYHGR